MSYIFYFGNVPLPVTPSKVQTKISGTNKTYTLINEGEINVLKSPKLTDISFDILIPSVKYPFAIYKDNQFKPVTYYLEMLEGLMNGKKPFQFIVTRAFPNGKGLYDTNMKVSLEDYTIKEDVKDGFDCTITVKLKQYKDYGTKTCNIQIVQSKPKASVNNPRPVSDNAPSGATYTIVGGDNLWKISRKQYGKATNATVKAIYNANKTVIEKVAKEHGKSSSQNGKWIWSGTVLTIPSV